MFQKNLISSPRRVWMKIILILSLVFTLNLCFFAPVTNAWNPFDTDETGDFTEFKPGEGFRAPDASGYISGITKCTTVRECALTITNFFLGFLGLAAVIMVIYGGVRYVTSAGEEEGATKGKKAVTYAVIGIIIVLTSYALVNTLITLEDESLAPAAGVSPISALDPETAANEVSLGAEQIIAMNNTHSDLQSNLTIILNACEEVINGDYTPQVQKQKLKAIKEILEYMGQMVDPLSDTKEVIDALIQEINQTQISFQPRFIAVAQADAADSIFGTVKNKLTEIEAAMDSDFSEQVDEYRDQLDELQGLYPGDIGNAITTLVNSVNDFENTMTNNSAQQVQKQAEQIAELIGGMEMVTVKIYASVSQGTVPLSVSFHAGNSIDPSGEDIADIKVQWDLDADGNFRSPTTSNNRVEECTETAHLHDVSCKYVKPGTYRVRARIESSDTAHYASGEAYLTIQVAPRKSKIKLTASSPVGSTLTTLADYLSTTPADELFGYKVLLSYASQGVEFDASESLGSDKLPVKSFDWEFGDGKDLRGDPEGKPIHPYTKNGQFPFKLTITGQDKIQDTKTVTIYVRSPIAKLKIEPRQGPPGTTFLFDANQSLSDYPPIENYTWTIENPNGVLVHTDSGSDKDRIRVDEFPESAGGPTVPGTYTVNLTVEDAGSTGAATPDSTDTVTDTFTIISRSPQPVFKCVFPEPNTNPGFIQCDATATKDPDPADTLDTLTFNWYVDNAVSPQSSGKGAGFRTFDYTFPKAGDHTIKLIVNDNAGEKGLIQKNYSLDSLLDFALFLDVEGAETIAYQLDDDLEKEVTFVAKSNKAKVYEVDFGDGEQDVVEKTGVSTSFTHVYREAGTFTITATATDEEESQRTVKRQVFMGTGEPIAIISATVESNPILDLTQPILLNRNQKINFSAEKSINGDGSARFLNYSWDLDDGTYSTDKQINHQYNGITSYSVTLKVTDKKDPTLESDPVTVEVEVQSLPPSFQNLIINPIPAELVTPIKVNVSPLDAEDPDGQIVKYNFWYSEEGSSKRLGVQHVTSPNVTLTINTLGLEGQEITYVFGLEVTDNEGKTFSTDDLAANIIPTLRVTNGPNKPPQADFTVDRSSIYVGEAVNFISTSKDPDGQIVKYEWDFDGNRIYEHDSTPESTATHTFNQKAQEGIEVRLQVTDSNGAIAVSPPHKIYVDTNTTPPIASFYLQENNSIHQQLKLENTSQKDASITWDHFEWDCDVDADWNLDGDGIPDNDVQLTTNAINDPAVCEYDTYDTFRLKLTVFDVEGNYDTTMRSFTLKAPPIPEDPIAAFTFQVDDANFPQSISFDPSASLADVSQGLTLDKYFWDFNLTEDENGDGQPDNDYIEKTSDLPFPRDYAPETGNHTVKLKVVDSQVGEDEIIRNIKILEPGQTLPPEAAFVTQILSAEDRQIKFDASNSVSYYFNDTALTYRWDLDSNTDSDGNGHKEDDIDNEHASPVTSFEYVLPDYGRFKVKLTIIDKNGLTASVTRNINLEEPPIPPPPEINFTYSLDPDNDKKVIFNVSDSYSNADPADLNFTWDLDIEKDSNSNGKNDDDNDPVTLVSPETFSAEYPEYGQFKVKLVGKDVNDQKNEFISSVYLPAPPPPEPPLAALSFSRLPDDPFTLKFTAQDSTTDDATIFYDWDFDTKVDADGNGKTDDDSENTESSPEFTFEAPGTYLVQVTVTDSLGQLDQAQKSVNIPAPGELPGPEAAFLATVETDTIVTLDASHSFAEANLTRFEWDLDLSKDTDGNGQPDDDIDESYDVDPAAPEVTYELPYTYSDIGAYRLKLTVYDQTGKSDFVTKSLYFEPPVSAAPPIAAFTYMVDDSTVSFSNNTIVDTAHGASLESTVWDFNLNEDSDGDGIPGNDQDSEVASPSYTYNEYGTYQAKLTVLDDQGNQDEVIRSINLLDPPQPDFPEAAFIITDINADTRVVTFDASNSHADPNWNQPAPHNVYLEDYHWDLDTLSDEDGNGIKDDDFAYYQALGATGSNFSFTYLDYGAKTVRLKVVDNYEGDDEITNSLSMEAPLMDARLISNPGSNVNDGKIHFKPENLTASNEGCATFDFSTSVGAITQFQLDKNIYFDSDGNGRKDDDINLSSDTPGQWSDVCFSPDWGTIVAKLSVLDAEGNLDSTILEIVFDPAEPTTPPEAAFSYEVNRLTKEVTLVANNLNDNSVTANYIWDLDLSMDANGNSVPTDDPDALGQIVSKTYGNFGTYRVQLTVVDELGQADSVIRTVQIDQSDNPPEAAFTLVTNWDEDPHGLTVDFDAVNSTAITPATLVSYQWDLDVSDDSDGNGQPDDDTDATTAQVRHTYPSPKTYQIKLTVIDSEGAQDEVIRSVLLMSGGLQQAIEARLTASPVPNVTDNKIHLSGEDGTVTFNFQESVGEITRYVLDKNIYYDTNGNGIRNDDEDMSATSPGTWSNVTYEKSWGRIISQLTVYDRTGLSDSVTIEITFDEPTMEPAAGANILATDTSLAFYLLATLGLTVILVYSISQRRKKKFQFIRKRLR